MFPVIKIIASSVTSLFFPQLCAGCSNDLSPGEQLLCISCNAQLPVTNFHMHASNPVEKIFWGRAPVTSAASLYYFSKNSVLQQLLHQFKYKGNKEIGRYLGNQMGEAFIQSNRFNKLDAVVALPLFPSKERKRGYNQAAVLCEGYSASSNTTFLRDVICRSVSTDTQTKKNRIERWRNMEGKFQVTKPELLVNKKVLLIDDVVTTGATLEACGHELLKVPGLQLNIATLAYTSS
ncbi:MAG: ComF family protein [Chitinophagaceae bacterium]|nr:ComF family protein [Chitinophagaceae bacterium]